MVIDEPDRSGLPRRQFGTFGPRRNVQDGVALSALEAMELVAGAVVQACSPELRRCAAEWGAEHPSRCPAGCFGMLISR